MSILWAKKLTGVAVKGYNVIMNVSTNDKIAVVDYGAGNLHSVLCGLKRVGAAAYVACSPAELKGCAGILLPGVGAFGYAARSLRDAGFTDALKEYAGAGVPLLGICLGMQLLFSGSEENPGAEGLGLVSGIVTRLRTCGLKVPHMGWTGLGGCKGRLMQGVSDGDYVYFVHSFGAHSNGKACATAEYGETFDAAVESGNVFGTQFHPEKSSDVGRKILKNFAAVCGAGTET